MLDLRHYFDIHIHCIVEQVPNAEQQKALTDIVKSVHCYEISTLDAYLSALMHFFNGLPNQVNMFTDEDVFWEMHDNLKLQNIDIVYCQLARMAKYALTSHKPKVLDYQDCFSINYSRSAANTKNILWKWIYSMEASRMRKFENKLASKMNASVIISEIDKANISNNGNIIVVPNGVDTTKYHSQMVEPNFDICFAGNLGYAPNILAVQFICNELIPIFEQHKFPIKILIAGASPSVQVMELCNKNRSITLKANVPNMTDIYNDVKIFVAPLFSGAGLQNKLLEAMSCGTPCICTSIVNASLCAMPNTEIVLADTAQDFFEKIRLLLQNISQQKALKTNAEAFINENYNWQVVNKKLIDVLHSAVKESQV